MSVGRRIAAAAMTLTVALSPAHVGTALAVPSPNAVADSYTVNEDQELTVDAGTGVLANDMPNSGTCVVENTDPANGSLGTGGVAADGSFTFTPSANFNGSTSFTYGMADASGGCPATSASTGSVTITVNAVNDAPTISAKNDCADGSVTVSENSGAYPSSQACVHFDSAGPSNESSQTLDSWVIAGSSGTVGFSSGPSFTKSGNDGYLHFTPAAGQTGDATVSVQAKDSGGTANGGIDLSNVIDIHIHVVNDAPVAKADSFIVLKNTTLNVQAPGVLQNDSDPNGDPLTAVKVTGPTHGVLTLAADGSFSYTPAAGYEGPDGFSYKASDGQLLSASAAVVSLTVTAIPPVATPTPIPTATPTPTDTPEPSVQEGLETFTPFPSDTGLASAGPSLAPGETAQATTAASLAPGASPAPGASSDGGGLPLPVLLVLVLFVLLVAFGAALYVPKWLKAQSGEPVDRE